mgnify:CR=1 FL=1
MTQCLSCLRVAGRRGSNLQGPRVFIGRTARIRCPCVPCDSPRVLCLAYHPHSSYVVPHSSYTPGYSLASTATANSKDPESETMASASSSSSSSSSVPIPPRQQRLSSSSYSSSASADESSCSSTPHSSAHISSKKGKQAVGKVADALEGRIAPRRPSLLGGSRHKTGKLRAEARRNEGEG